MLLDKIIRVIKLDKTLFAEIANDNKANFEAVIIVALTGLAAGVGAITLKGVTGILSGVVGAIIGWLVLTMMIYVLGVKLFPDQDTPDNLKAVLRVMAFAAAPGLFRVFGLIVPLMWLAFLGTSFWTLIVEIIAVKETLKYNNIWKAIAICFTALFFSWVIVISLSGRI